MAVISAIATAPLSGQLIPDDNQIFAQGFAGLPGAPDRGDFFGNALAAGDFNGDGFLDLAIGVPGDNNGQARGTVNVVYGAPGGLRTQGAQEWIQGRNGLEGNDERDDQFGAALAAGDFDNDGFDDLAVGVPGEDRAQGIVAVLYGTSSGLTGDRDQVWDQGDLDGGGRQQFDRFGSSLAVGDFNGDNFMDLAVGTPFESNSRGLAHVIYGSASGLTSDNNQRFRQGADGLEGTETNGDFFGAELTAGDFNGDGFDDLAVGVPGEDNGRGGVQVLFGAAGRIDPGPDVFLRQGDNQIPGDRNSGDVFGGVLAAGDFNNDGFVDLVAGAIGEANGRGSVTIINGAMNGLTGPAIEWRQGLNGVLGEQNPGDRFGTDFAIGDFNADGFLDLAVGARGEAGNAGIVHVIYGSLGGLTAQGNQVFAQGVNGILDQPEAGDDFGGVLAAGDFGFDGADDLAISAAREDGDRGIVHVIYGLRSNLPSISAIVSAGLGVPTVNRASYNAILTIFGENFAPEDFARVVTGADLVNGRLPTRLGGVCVEMNGERSPLFAVFSNQINFQARLPIGQRPQEVVVRVLRDCGGPLELRSPGVAMETAAAAPEFFFFRLNMNGVNPVAAVNESTGVLVGRPGLLPGAQFAPVRRGQVVTVFMTGLGETMPRVDPGELPQAAARTVRPVIVSLGGIEIQPTYAGVTPFNAGLYQVSFIVPPNAILGDNPLAIFVGDVLQGVRTAPGAFIPIAE